MHVLILLLSPALVGLVGLATLGLLRQFTSWDRHREVQLLVLAAPLLTLALGLGGVHHFAGQVCFIGAPPWDYTLSLGIPLVMALFALAAIVLGVVRLTLVRRVSGRGSVVAGPELQALVNDLAARLRAPRSRLVLRPLNQPLALTHGLVRPTIVLSTWMVAHLDHQELESVLAHEVAHVARRDYLVAWVGTVLRDAFWYLPTSWRAHRQLQQEKELACDDLAVAATGRPLALASALARVWQHSLASPPMPLPRTGALPLADLQTSPEARIRRLLGGGPSTAGQPRSTQLSPAIAVSALLALGLTQAANAAVLLAPMGCSPATMLGQIF